GGNREEAALRRLSKPRRHVRTMTCEFDDDLLSGYLDDELDDELRVAVRAHLDGCDACSRRLQEMAGLSDRFAASRQVDLPEGLWNRIEEARRTAVASESVRRPGRRSPAFRGLRQWTVAAAAVVVAFTLPWIWSLQRASDVVGEEAGADRFVPPAGIALAKYVEEIRAGDEEAGEFLEMHRGRRISLEEMAEHASFRPSLPEQLPSGFQVEKCYVLSTGCGNAFKLDCVREAQRLTIFLQPAEGSVLLEGQLQGCMDIGGVHCRGVVVQDVRVLSWSSGGCTTTVVCAPGDADVESIVCCLLQEEEQKQEQEQEPEQEPDP
ncbi:MAG: anti-sigma factor family protein, partial [Planctomycetota bacterium]